MCSIVGHFYESRRIETGKNILRYYTLPTEFTNSPFELFSTFEDFVGKLDADEKEHYIMGDFNCNMLPQEPITWSLHTCFTLESTLSDKELFLEQAFPRN